MSEDAVTILPAERIEVPLFRQILLVPFAIKPAPTIDDGSGTAKLVKSLERILDGDSLRRWRKLPEPLLHLPEDRVPDTLEPAERARRLAGAYEEFVYFEPYVQDFLYTAESNSSPPLRIWQSDRVAYIEIEYDLNQPKPDTGERTSDSPDLATFRFSVERCNLYVFSTGTVILAVELLLKSKKLNDVGAPCTLRDILSLLESVRRMFPPYFARVDDRNDEASAPLHAVYYPRSLRSYDRRGRPLRPASDIDPTEFVGKVVGRASGSLPKYIPLFEPWRRLLEPLTVEGYFEAGRKPPVTLSQLGDDRAFVLAQVGVANPAVISQGDWARLCFLDSPGDGMPYAEDFLRNFERDHCYDRFFFSGPGAATSTRYLVCNYAMVVVGASAPLDEVEAARSDFFRHVIGRHVRRQYFNLVLIAFLQKTALKGFSDRAAGTMFRQTPAAELIQREILDFTHRYWFEDISAQLQAQELFDMLRHHLRLRPLYAQLSQEVREANALAAEKSAHSLNVIAGFGLAASVIVGFFGMNVLGSDPGFIPADGRSVVGIAALLAAFFILLFCIRKTVIRWFATHKRWSWTGTAIILLTLVGVGAFLLGTDGTIGMGTIIDYLKSPGGT